MAQPLKRPVLDAEAQSAACMNLQMMRASHFVLQAYDEAYRPYGIKATQMPVLSVIGCRGPIGIKDVAEVVASERSVLSRKLQVMEKNGWIKEDAATTGREKTFVLTEEGRKLLETVVPVRDQVQQTLLQKLSAEERDLLMSLCGKLQA